MITYKNRPSWSQSFKGSTHILRMRNVFRYFFATEMGHGDFENHDGETLNDFVVIEKKPSNGPVTIANTFLEKPDWSLAFVGATHIINVNNIGLQKITYHFAKKTGEQFTNSVGTPFTNVTVVSQHVMGDCVEECLDKAIYILKGKK